MATSPKAWLSAASAGQGAAREKQGRLQQACSMTLLMGRPCSGQASSEGALQPRLGRGAMRFVSGQTITEGVQIDRGPALLQQG